MITTVRLMLPLLLAMGRIAFGKEELCHFEVHMFSNATSNDCFDGWALMQAANLAKPLLQSWEEKNYPQLINPDDEYFGIKALTMDEYNALDGDEKKVYEQTMQDWGWNSAYNLNFPYCKDQGYRSGWKIEYEDKLLKPKYFRHKGRTSKFVPIAAPTDEIPQEPGPKPELVTTADHTTWYVEYYDKGWKAGCDDGFKEGEEEGKAAGKVALLQGTEYSEAYESAYKKGYNDSRLGLGSPMNRRHERQLRGAERNFREHYSNGYSQGYDEALTAQAKKDYLGDRNNRKLLVSSRKLASTCTRWCTSTTQRYNYCLVIGSCSGDWTKRRQLNENTTLWESNYVETLPQEGVSGGNDFRNLLAHVLDKSAEWKTWALKSGRAARYNNKYKTLLSSCKFFTKLLVLLGYYYVV
jgi:hypothetical protein